MHNSPLTQFVTCTSKLKLNIVFLCGVRKKLLAKTVLTKSSYLHLETELKCNVQVRLGTVMIYDFKCARNVPSYVPSYCQVTV